MLAILYEHVSMFMSRFYEVRTIGELGLNGFYTSVDKNGKGKILP